MQPSDSQFSCSPQVVSSANTVERVHSLLQTDVTSVVEWSAQNQLTVNEDKTKVLWTYPSTRPLDTTDLDFIINGKTLSVVNTFNYLGVVIDRHLTFCPHLQKVIGTVRSKYTQLWNTRKETKTPL